MLLSKESSLQRYIISKIKPTFNVLTLLTLLFLIGCKSSANYFHNFKEDKKEIDSLTILKPIVNIKGVSRELNESDLKLNSLNTILIDSITNKLLKNRYSKIKNIDYKFSNLNIVDSIFNKLDLQKEKTIISLEKLFENGEINTTDKYALLLIYNGRYNPKFPPHFRTQSTMSGVLVLNRGEKMTSESDLRMIVIETKTKEIVLIDKLKTLRFDPRVKKEVEQLTRTTIKKMYYK